MIQTEPYTITVYKNTNEMKEHQVAVRLVTYVKVNRDGQEYLVRGRYTWVVDDNEEAILEIIPKLFKQHLNNKKTIEQYWVVPAFENDPNDLPLYKKVSYEKES